jgi:cellulose synthase/poly-beta-1,6-N-acetylglucosamine synthase-like glycosyltransferase
MAEVLPFKSLPADDAPPVERARPFLGDILVRSGKLAQAQLDEALIQQRGQDTLLGQILIVGGMISRKALTEALCEQAEIGPIDLEAAPPDRAWMARVDPYRCLELEAVPWRYFGGRYVIAVANPDNGPEAMRALGREGDRMALGIAPAETIRRTIASHFGDQMVARAERLCPEHLSCRSLLGARLTWRKSLALAGLAGAAVLAPIAALHLALAWVLLTNLMTMGLRLAALFARFRAGGTGPTPAAPRLVDYRRLPRVSILVPLKREAAVAGQLLAALERMEYPAPLLDIKLVLEAGDGETRAALEQAGLPPTVEVLSVPAGTIQTKPRAMNYALPFCKGEIIGVYDAEDKPDPGQIRAVVHHLMDAPASVGCVQGLLDFYNAGENWLARCFTIEYATWFRVLLLGMQRLGLPIPLGGTTVFFRRRALEEVGAWDAHNVTEDADLGMRLRRFGYSCDVVATTTEEEANCRSAGRWIRQRSRWLKGYAITWATHMRDPRALLRELGPAGFMGFQVLFLGGLTSYLATPLFWLLWTGAFGLGLGFWDHLDRGLTIAFFASMALGNLVMVLTAWVALVDSGRGREALWILTLVGYWQLGAVAAYRAVAEIFYAPFHWHKTEHGGPATGPIPHAAATDRHLPDADARARGLAHVVDLKGKRLRR